MVRLHAKGSHAEVVQIVVQVVENVVVQVMVRVAVRSWQHQHGEHAEQWELSRWMPGVGAVLARPRAESPA